MISLWRDVAAPIPTDPFVDGGEYDSVIVGAGLTGLTTALLLARHGMRVAVLEARTVGAVTTGNTTGKVSLLQGTTLSQIRRHTTDKVLCAYVDANTAGQGWLLDYLDERSIPYDVRDAYTYATTLDGRDKLDAELSAARVAGLAATEERGCELPFAVEAALRLPAQAQVDPMALLASLAADVRALGGVIVEGERVTGVSASEPAVVTSTSGTTRAGNVVLASGTPILDRGLYFAKTEPLRSYITAFRVPGELPRGMYLSADEPTRSLRTAGSPDGELLLVGGNGHVAGRAESPAALVADLTAWTETTFPGAERTHWWAAQDYRSANQVPFVGWLPRGRGRVFLATGYNKWGMTNGVAAALSLTADLTGETIEWARVLHHRVTHPIDIATGAVFNAGVGKAAVTQWAEAETGGQLPVDAPPPAEGTGVVGRRGASPVAVSTVDGVTCALSAVCTHLGGVVRWNDAELSWDCPLHGSRFAPDGTVLEGPATSALKPVDDAEPAGE
ncbi:FAD-dependent oxidoreductase [Leifsonia sp. PS1209]|uniref:FAD-dependent oxidoreductase n=1 Tax=Leifsonia sp. PS1209 TaxID=2724914 RepID=UPI001442B4B5|nr:FAD-dependent oxidoreductase [Leifsonia sp. PS1209]QJA00347.1 FAD-dependent oxidoreductase [Leifsonia sp. PS1209]